MKQFAYVFLLAVWFLPRFATAQTNFWQQTNWPDSLFLPVIELAVNSSGHIFAGAGACLHALCSGRLYRSMSNGDTWQISLYGYIGALATNPNGDVLVGWGVAERHYVSRSTDIGETWTQTDSSLLAEAFVTTTGTIFAGGAIGVIRSTNDGITWTRPDTTFEAYVLALAVNTSGYIFAGTSRYGGWGFLYRSTNNGDTWANVSFSDTSDVTALAVNSLGHIFAGTSDNYVRGRVLESTDNGNSWTTLYSLPAQTTAMVFNSNDDLFVATAGAGVYRNGIQINSGLTTLNVYSIAIAPDGFIYAGTDSGVFRSVQSTVGVEEIASESPTSFRLSQNYPNPFNPATTFAFSIPYSSFVILKVYDLLGREVATLVNEEMKPGSYEVTWDASRFPSGVYFYRLQSSSFVETKKLILLK